MRRNPWKLIVASLLLLLVAGWVGYSLYLSGARTKTAARPGPPNVILILTDDLGYGDLSCQGGKIPTPNIDSIARDGVRFTHAYASASVCSPSRAGLLTGKYQQRFGHEFNGEFSRRTDDGLPTDQRTLGDGMKSRGYVTGCIGKWHLGVGDQFHPIRRGFDEFFGFLGGSHSYQDSSKNKGLLTRGTALVQEEEYLTDAFTREAVDFVKRHRDRPFFLYLPYNAVHTPMEAPGKFRREAAKYVPHERTVYGGMILSLDEQVGRLLGALEQNGLDENTIVIFASDNGGRPVVADNGGLSGGKHELSEGGIRVPVLVRWKGKVPGGQVKSEPVILLDLHATALAAGGGAPGGDGLDLMPLARGEGAMPERYLYWRQGESGAVRRGNWKLMREEGKSELFDLSVDPGEKADLAGNRPEVVQTLGAEWERWSGSLAKPRWREPRRAESEDGD